MSCHFQKKIFLTLLKDCGIAGVKLFKSEK